MTGWEPERIDSMHATLRPGDLVYDIGAEEGDMPGLWASWGCDVLLVEPNPRVWPNVRAIFEANDLTDRLRGYFVGFASDHQTPGRPGWTEEHVGAEPVWPACAFGEVIRDHGFLVIDERPDCPATTVDLLAELYGPPDAITIDVEGAEYRVLRGARRTLETARPVVWVSIHTDLEWMRLRYATEGAAVLHRYMAELGYVPEHLATDHEEHWIFHHPDGRRPGVR